MKSLFIIIVSIVFSVTLIAQPSITFSKKVHDFGTIKEIDGKVKYVFSFTNSGDSDLKLSNVRTSCGCTASDWTKTAIAAGEKGFVSATFNPKGRPGPFSKAVTIATNSPKTPNIAIYIKGKVIPKPKSKADLYPTSMGNLRFNTNHLAFMNISNKETRTDSLFVYNNGKAPMNLEFDKVPDWLKIVAKPSTLNPKQEGVLIITFKGRKRNDYGLNFDRFVLLTNDVKQPNKTINVSAKVLPDFSKMNQRKLDKAPKIVFKNKYYDFGKIKKGSKITYNFEFVNEGKKDLVILKTISSCGCTAINSKASIIKQQESGSIGIVFSTAGRTGKQHKTVTIISNDPRNPEIILHISGELK